MLQGSPLENHHSPALLSEWSHEVSSQYPHLSLIHISSVNPWICSLISIIFAPPVKYFLYLWNIFITILSFYHIRAQNNSRLQECFFKTRYFRPTLWPDKIAVSGLQTINENVLTCTEAVFYRHKVNPLCCLFHRHPSFQRLSLIHICPHISIFIWLNCCSYLCFRWFYCIICIF